MERKKKRTLIIFRDSRPFKGLARAASSSRELSSSCIPVAGSLAGTPVTFLDFGTVMAELRVTLTLFEFAVVRLMPVTVAAEDRAIGALAACRSEGRDALGGLDAASSASNHL